VDDFECDLWKFARNSLTFEQAVGVGTCLLGVWLYNQKETKATVWIYRVMACSWKAVAGFIKGPQKIRLVRLQMHL